MQQIQHGPFGEGQADMYGDPAFILVASGSTATSAGPAELLFGSYQGLSTLNNSEVVLIRVGASEGGIFFVGGDNTLNTLTGIRLGFTVGVPFSVFLNPMRTGEASGLHLRRQTTDNGIADWAIWRRLP